MSTLLAWYYCIGLVVVSLFTVTLRHDDQSIVQARRHVGGLPPFALFVAVAVTEIIVLTTWPLFILNVFKGKR